MWCNVFIYKQREKNRSSTKALKTHLEFRAAITFLEPATSLFIHATFKEETSFLAGFLYVLTSSSILCLFNWIVYRTIGQFFYSFKISNIVIL